MFLSDPLAWAQSLFQQAQLGDLRRTQRLVQLSAQLAANTGKSMVQSLQSDADIEAAYRFIRNDNIPPQAIAEAGYQVTANLAQSFDCLLAIEDTTSLQFSHATVADELGHTTSKKSSRGLHAHSVLLFAPKEQEVIGLVEQHRWARDPNTYGQSQNHAKRKYTEKESFKWQRASEAMTKRLGSHMEKVISVCDREADIIDYLSYKSEHKQRFVVRSMQSRHIEECDNKLYAFSETLQSAGTKMVHVPQRGGRKARDASCDIRFAAVTLKCPANKDCGAVELYYVVCHERDNKEGLCWHLLTSETVTTASQAREILGYYERRWLIEDFHKSWKSGGTQVESLRMQSKNNLERGCILLSFIAVRLQQLRYMSLQTERANECSCENLLNQTAWKLLWLKVEKNKPPKQPPSLYWAYKSLGRLAGWNDSKRTGIVGWERLWQGWFELQTILEGYYLSLSLKEEM